MMLEEPNDIEQYLNNQHDNNQKFHLPEVIGILPVRNAVVFPGTIMPLAIGRDQSKSLLKKIKVHKSVIGIVTQHDPGIDQPDFDDLYSIGTAATVLKMIKLPQGSLHIVVHGIARFKISQPLSLEPYLKAETEPLRAQAKITKKLQALMVNVRQDAYRVISLSPNVPEEASGPFVGKYRKSLSPG
ncbi:MAG: LON peptidase substrate-binding domain-containing protein [Planctomycetota bacterium]|jgi:ATP-dependent Lon protease